MHKKTYTPTHETKFIFLHQQRTGFEGLRRQVQLLAFLVLLSVLELTSVVLRIYQATLDDARDRFVPEYVFIILFFFICVRVRVRLRACVLECSVSVLVCVYVCVVWMVFTSKDHKLLCIIALLQIIAVSLTRGIAAVPLLSGGCVVFWFFEQNSFPVSALSLVSFVACEYAKFFKVEDNLTCVRPEIAKLAVSTYN